MRVARFRAARGRAGQIPRFSCSMERCCHVPGLKNLSACTDLGSPAPPKLCQMDALGNFARGKKKIHWFVPSASKALRKL